MLYMRHFVLKIKIMNREYMLCALCSVFGCLSEIFDLF